MADKERIKDSTPAQIADDDAMEIDLLELFYRIVGNIKYIIGAALLGMLIMAVYTYVLVTPIYEATSKLYVMNSKDSAINLSDLQIGSYLTSDYQEVFKTWEVHEMVMSNLALSYDYTKMQGMVRVTNPSNTRILYITVSSPNPKEAATIANEYATVAANYISETMQTDEPRLLSVALEPTRPVSPRKVLNLAMGVLMGIVAAIAVITIRFIADDKIKTADDIRKYTGMATLAVVPVMNGANRGRKGGNERKR